MMLLWPVFLGLQGSRQKATDVEVFVNRFEQGLVKRDEWTHEAHLKVAFHYASTIADPLPILRDRIRHHNRAIGTPETDTSGYHETLTVFWLQVVTNYLRWHPKDALNSFLKTEMAETTYPLKFYSRDRLFSVEARHHYVEPDIQDIHFAGSTDEPYRSSNFGT